MSIERYDLRKTIFPGSKTYPVTDEDLAALGYVKMEPLKGDPITPSRDALRFVRFGIANGIETQLVTDEDLAALGYVRLDVDKMVERIVEAVDICFEPSIGEQPEGDAWLDDIAREVKLAVLDALDGEET